MSQPRIGLTGASSFLGGRLLRRLVDRYGPDRVVVYDVAAPPARLGVRYRDLDLTRPASDQWLLDMLREDGIETLAHFAFFTNPRRDKNYAHELESIGSLSVFAAAAAAGVRHVLLRSSTFVYGARGQNPNFVTEDKPLHPDLGLAWIRDKYEAEHHATAFAKRYPEMTFTTLRFAPLFGPGVHTFYTRIFDHRVVPVLFGFDPLVQLLHPDDADAAIDAALEHRKPGAFNVVPTRPLPLRTALHLAAKIPVSVAHPVAYLGADVMWAAGLAEAPGGFVDYVRYSFMGDGEKARVQLGFEPRYSTRDALSAYLRYRHPRRSRRPPAVVEASA
jgi:UDP-glucose 4-epimerase